MGAERTQALFGVWRRVNEIATTTEDTRAIRALIGETGIVAGTHIGRDPDEFTPEMIAEWVLGNWVEMIDAGSPFLNSARNISLHWYDKTVTTHPGRDREA